MEKLYCRQALSINCLNYVLELEKPFSINLASVCHYQYLETNCILSASKIWSNCVFTGIMPELQTVGQATKEQREYCQFFTQKKTFCHF